MKRNVVIILCRVVEHNFLIYKKLREKAVLNFHRQFRSSIVDKQLVNKELKNIVKKIIVFLNGSTEIREYYFKEFKKKSSKNI